MAAQHARRQVERPPYEQLRAEVEALGWSGVGRKYGVSDNAVRKWMRAYERGEVNLAAAPDVVEKRGCAGSGEVES